MILIGACRHPERLEAAVAVAEASLRRGEKRYLLHRLDETPSSDSAAFIHEVISRVGGGGLRRAKRLFSQDRRPKKTVADPPKVVALDDRSRMVGELRNKGIVVEAIRPAPGKPWQKNLVGKALGADYTADPLQILTCAGNVLEQGRVAAVGPSVKPALDRIAGALSSPHGAPPEAIPAIVLALALPLWFRETVPYRRAYRAN